MFSGISEYFNTILLLLVIAIFMCYSRSCIFNSEKYKTTKTES